MSRNQQIEGTRHGHPLPQVRSASTYFVRGAAIVLVLSVVGLPLNVALGGNSAMVAGLVVLEFISLLCLVFGALSQRGVKQAIPKILTDKQTMHWTYQPSEWQRFSTQAWQRSIRTNMKVTGIAWGVVLVVLLLGIAESNGAVDIPLALTLGTGVAVMIGVLLFASSALLLQWRRRQTMLDVYLHPNGFILNGWYSGLNWTVGGRKKITYMAGDPGVLRFDVGSGRGARVLEVPVPQGHEAEAEQVAQGMRFYRA